LVGFADGGSGVDADCSPVIGGGEGVADDVWRRTVNSGKASKCSIASGRGEERRLEMLRAAVIFGCGRGNRISVGKDQVDASNEAPGRGNKMRRRSRARAHWFNGKGSN
jgi:hypothetical protein